MAKDENRRLSPSEQLENEHALTTLENLSGYAPANASYTVTKIQEVKAAVDAARREEKRAHDALRTTRDRATTAEWNFHNAILKVKQQIIAQYGDDSAEVQLFGLKKKSEYRKPTRKVKA